MVPVVGRVIAFNGGFYSTASAYYVRKMHWSEIRSAPAIQLRPLLHMAPGGAIRVSFWTYPWTIADLSWQRMGFHFQTEANWMNDPNGPLVYKGWYHLLYQYNPVSVVWGNIAWGHAVSKDLVHWFYLDLAMIPDCWYDINGVWTGSALHGIHTGSTNESVQVQNLPFPEDPSYPLLRKWMKSEANPVLVPPKGVRPKDFRDPTTGWIGKDGIWRIGIGSKLGMTGVTLVFKTKDFIEYEQENILHSVNGTGMWECVDLFPVAVSGIKGLDTSANGVGVKHVLKASFDDDKNDYYAIGTYDLEKQRFIPDDPAVDVGLGLLLDYGKYYASKSSLCWNAIGDYVASVSEDSVKISSMKAGGRCVQEISCTGNLFQTCVFHPNHPSLLIIGCDRTFEFWNMAENKTMSLESHDALIIVLAQSPATRMVASASHDKCVKLWK